MSWALIIAGAVLPAILLLTAANLFWLHWYRYYYTIWVINSPSLLGLRQCAGHSGGCYAASAAFFARGNG